TGPRARHVEYGVYKLGWAAPLHVNGSVARISIAPDLSGKLGKLLSLEQFDVLHLHEPLASALSLSILHLADRLGATLVGTFHAYSRPGLTSTPRWAYSSARPFLGHYFRRLDGRIAVSAASAEFVARFFPAEYRIIPNGVDTTVFNPNTPPLTQFLDGKLNILYHGRIEQRKGLKYLLGAIPMIREHFPNTRFLIGGDGPLRQGFERQVERASWPDVVFLGRVPAETLPSLYTTAHVFCAPNTGGEGQGIVLLEALAAGRAVVASDIAGFRSVIADQRDSLLVKPSDSEQIAWAICNLLADEPARARLGLAGRLRAEAFSWARVGDQVEAYYEQSQGQARVRQEALAARRGALQPTPASAARPTRGGAASTAQVVFPGAPSAEVIVAE
ncbi:MAG TPA: glycosyltransferase family 4 protein, partial [Ktedonobacterales bacterium]|nr:glycosyltransferase family 4 protein [Ktedonobacterales bacterium]